MSEPPFPTHRACIPGLTVLEAVAYVAWADGRLAADEVSAARGVATVLGLAGPGTKGPGLLARGPIEPSELELEDLEQRHRELVYATAAWIAMADGVLDRAERRALAVLRERLGLTAERCMELEDLVFPYCGDAEWDRRYAGIVNELGAH
jgi:hypothetical protein